MKEEERNAIAYALLKVVVKEQLQLKTISAFNRKVGNLSKETGISKEKIHEVAKGIIREVFEEQMKAMG